MPKYKKITEGVIDSFIGAVFNIVGKGTHSAALTGIAKKAPEIAKKVQMIQKNRKELKQMLKKAGVPKLTRAEKRALAKGEYLKK